MHLAILLPALLLLNGCASAAVQAPPPGVPSARSAAVSDDLRQALVAEVAGNPSLPGELVHVLAPRLGVDTSLAAGVFDRGSGRALRPHDGFRAASVTKTFTAAAILRLVEEGRLGLDDPVIRHLPAEYVALLLADGYVVDAITVRHLLTHTSGIFDYATDQRYFEAVFGNPARRWTRIDQVRAAMEWGQPRFSPGSGYHYSDTGYILLGEILERLAGQPLGKTFRTLLGYERLGLDETYLESLEPRPAGASELSHPYFGELDTFAFDPSLDLYGGGGLVSSTEDLARFYRALIRGEVFRHPATLQVMLAVPPTNERSPGGPYAMGIQRMTIGGQECWGHTGFWGTAAHHCPVGDVTIVRHTNQAQPDESFRFRALHDRIAQLLESY
jgi:D-alanyl-D-alanine carboxypeptidase